MNRIIATCLALVLVTVPAASGIGAVDDTQTDADALAVPAGHVAVVDVDLTGDTPEIQMTTASEDEVFPTMTTQSEQIDRPNCLFADEGSTSVGYGALNVAGESLSPLVEAGAAEPCEFDRYNAGIESVTFATSSEDETSLLAIEHAGFIGIGGLLRITCDATEAGLAHGPTDDMETVDCDVTLQGNAPTTWSNWDGTVFREDASGASYATFSTQ